MLRYAPESGRSQLEAYAMHGAPAKKQIGGKKTPGVPASPEGWASLAARAGVCVSQLRDLVALIDLLPEGADIRGTLTDLELARALVHGEEVFDLVDQFNLAPGPGCAPEALAVQAEAQAARMRKLTADIYALAPGGLRIAPGFAGSPENPYAIQGSGDGNGDGNGDLAGVLPWALGAVAVFLLLRGA